MIIAFRLKNNEADAQKNKRSSLVVPVNQLLNVNNQPINPTVFK